MAQADCNSVLHGLVQLRFGPQIEVSCFLCARMRQSIPAPLATAADCGAALLPLPHPSERLHAFRGSAEPPIAIIAVVVATSSPGVEWKRTRPHS